MPLCRFPCVTLAHPQSILCPAGGQSQKPEPVHAAALALPAGRSPHSDTPPAQLPSELLMITPKRTGCFSSQRLSLCYLLCPQSSSHPLSLADAFLFFKPLLPGGVFPFMPLPLFCHFMGDWLLCCDGLGLLWHQTMSSTREGNSFLHSMYCGYFSRPWGYNIK